MFSGVFLCMCFFSEKCSGCLYMNQLLVSVLQKRVEQLCINACMCYFGLKCDVAVFLMQCLSVPSEGPAEMYVKV